MIRQEEYALKTIDLKGIGTLRQIREGINDWLFALEFPYGDLYEAQELHEEGRPVRSNRLLLVHLPDATVYEPVHKKDCVIFGQPVYCDGKIGIMAVDFFTENIRVYQFSTEDASCVQLAEMALSEVKDCYNLMLHSSPMMLTRQPNDGTFDIIWPERRTFPIGSRETFYGAENGRMFFSTWVEDPDYHEHTVVRSYPDGELIEELKGNIDLLPDGQWWYMV